MEMSRWLTHFAARLTLAARLALPALAALLVLALLLSGASAFAQGSRKDDVVFNAQGRPMAGASVRVCTASATGQPCSPLALIYSDAGLTQALANPTATDGLGNYSFYAAPGLYEIEISGPSITTKQMPNVILPPNPTSPTFTTVTTTSGISAFSLSLSGNLTVAGSAAITGSLTVGGASIPSTSQDLQWTASQRFKGPDPWRDITAYMPAGGCDNSAASLTREVGTINSGSTALTLTYDNGFKNGCGIFVAGAGPASTLATPAQGSAPSPNVIGTAGTTTVHYKVAAIDANFGTSAASAAIAITTAPATRTPVNYVAVYWQAVANAAGYLVYTDQNGGGTYVPLGYSFDCFGFTAGSLCGTIDKGVEANTWTGFNGFWPVTPPSAVTNQALVTTIASGAGTTSLVLATAASTSVASAFTFPDNSMFFKQAVADAANDGSPSTINRGTVYVPQGLWFLSTIPFPSSSILGVKIVLNGALDLFGLPIEGNLPGTGGTGQISITGTGGGYESNNWFLSCSQINAYSTLGALFVVYGAGSGLDLSHVCLSVAQTGIVQDSQGSVMTRDSSFVDMGSGPILQVDDNAFFSLFDRTNWNNSANSSNTQIPSIWFLGLTNSGHTSVFDFRDNAFVSHTIRMDIAYSGGGGPFGNMVFDGTTTVEDNWDMGFITLATCNAPSSVTLDNVVTGDVMAPSQTLLYSFSSCGVNPGSTIFVHGQTAGFSQLVGSPVNNGNLADCRAWIYDSPNSGSTGSESIGYWGNIFGSYSGCDLGITQIGYDVQTSEVLTSGGNDSFGPAGEQIIGHVFRRPVATVTGTGSGLLSAGTYYFKVTVLDVAGRESAPSVEISQTVGASSSISVSASTLIYFPASCNVYFGTSSGTEGNYFNSTAVTNGTCTFTLGSTAGEIARAPVPVGNAMRSWLTEENSANSCLFCGTSNGGTGFLGMFLTQPQYAAAASTGGPGLFVAGGLYKMSGSNAVPVAVTVANGTSALGTSAIASGACASVVTATASGALATDNLSADFNADPSGTAGYGVSASGVLTIYKWVTSGQVNFKVCNSTSASVTPGAATLQWRVVR